MSCDLFWDEHLNTISKKAYQTLDLLRGTISSRSVRARKLLYLTSAKQDQFNEIERRWISEGKKVQQIHSIDDIPAGGCHFDWDKTRDKVTKIYLWYGQYEDIDHCVETCQECQKVVYH